MKPREAGALQHPPTMQRGVPEPQRLHLPSREPDACPASLTRVRSPQNKDLSPHGAQRDGSKPVFLPPCSGRRPFASGTYFVLRRLCKGFGNVVFPLHGVGNGTAEASQFSAGAAGRMVSTWDRAPGPGQHSGSWLLCPGRSVPAGAQRAATRLGRRRILAWNNSERPVLQLPQAIGHDLEGPLGPTNPHAGPRRFPGARRGQERPRLGGWASGWGAPAPLSHTNAHETWGCGAPLFYFHSRVCV